MWAVPYLVSVTSVEPLDGYRVRLTFDDRCVKEIDLEPFLWGPVFQKIHDDLHYFRTVHIDEEGDTICWNNGANIDPNTLRFDLTPAGMEDRKLTQVASRKSTNRRTKPAGVKTAPRKKSARQPATRKH